MVRAVAFAIALTLSVVLVGDRPARAGGAAEPALTDGPTCCPPRLDYRSRTSFVPEMLRSVEAL
jgi:hypothetical protein